MKPHLVRVITLSLSLHLCAMEGVSDLNIDPKDPKSRLTDSDREKADVLRNVFKCFYYRCRW